jgi:hypothetical protein
MATARRTSRCGVLEWFLVRQTVEHGLLSTFVMTQWGCGETLRSSSVSKASYRLENAVKTVEPSRGHLELTTLSYRFAQKSQHNVDRLGILSQWFPYGDGGPWKRTIARVASLALLIGLVEPPLSDASTHVFAQFGSRAPYLRTRPV